MLALAVALVALAAPATADQQRQWRWDGVADVVAIGDVHGAFPSLAALLEHAGLLSPDGHWMGGSAHLVMLGDVLDRGPESRRALDLIMRLQGEAAAAGGMVHMLLGNHEVMNLVGDLRYVSADEYAAFSDEEDPRERKEAVRRATRLAVSRERDLGKVRAKLARRCPDGFFGHRAAFSPDGVYGKWLLEQQILVVIDGVVFVHGGLAPALLDVEPDRLNDVAMSQLRRFVDAQYQLVRLGVLAPEASFHEQLQQAAELARQTIGRSAKASLVADLARRMVDASGGLVFDPEGPLWYRGTSLNPAHEELDTVSQVLAHLDARTVVVGHTPTHTGRISTRFAGAVVRADTGMLTSHYGGQASAVVLRDNELFSLYPDEGYAVLPTDQWEVTAGLFDGDEDVAGFLRTAAVVAVEDVGSGTTRPQRVTLADDGRRCRAIFKTVEHAVSCHVPGGGTDCHDSYRHEVAAYLVDRALGLGLVPATVIREIGGVRGSLQLWVEGAVNEENRRDEDLLPNDQQAFDAQLGRTDVFDLLIFNADREPSSILITLRDWRLHLIDHSRAFVPAVGRPVHLEYGPRPDHELAARLAALDIAALRAELAELLTGPELDALVGRLAEIAAAVPAGPGEHPTGALEAMVGDGTRGERPALSPAQ